MKTTSILQALAASMLLLANMAAAQCDTMYQIALATNEEITDPVQEREIQDYFSDLISEAMKYGYLVDVGVEDPDDV